MSLLVNGKPSGLSSEVAMAFSSGHLFEGRVIEIEQDLAPGGDIELKFKVRINSATMVDPEQYMRPPEEKKPMEKADLSTAGRILKKRRRL